MLRTELRNLPAWNVAMQTIKKGGVRSHLRRERVKQRGSLKQHIHALIDVSYKDHRCRCCLFLFATGKGAGSHIVLHNLNAVFVLKLDSCNLIKGNAVPQAYQTHGFAPHIVKQICNGRLTTGYQDTVRADFFIDMGLSCAARPQLTEIEVVLHQR